MKRLGILLMLSLVSASVTHAATDDVRFVNPLLGTQRSAIGYGGTMPFVTAPFGMTSWTAQTRQNRVSVVSYNYDDPTISGFMGTHQPAIWMGDYGYVTLMPEVGALKTAPAARALKFSHAQEQAHPDLYTVKLDTGAGKAIDVAMTASARCGMMRFVFPNGAPARVLVETSRPGIDGYAAVDAQTHEITGYNPDRMDRVLGPDALPHFKGYFVIEFSQPWISAATYGLGTQQSRGAAAEFKPGSTVEVRVGTSFLSIDEARANLRRELPDWNLDAAQARLHAAWQEKLSRLQIEGATDLQKSRLYTALYHALLYPRVFSEDGHYYSAYDDRVHAGQSYTDYSIWDTFRAENSMLTLFAPERIGGMITALLQDYQEGGWMPKWPNPSYTNIMIGTHADSMVAEAIRKNLGGFDRQLAWKAVWKDAMVPPDGDTHERWADRAPHTPYEGRGGLTYYKALGFIPTDETDEASSRTLEDSYDDWCVAQVARALGRMQDYRFFLHRSLNDRHLWNPAVGLMQGKHADGSWAPLGEMRSTLKNRVVSGWTEGDTWVYTWAPLHDQAGLMQLMGGAKGYDAKLDTFFADGYDVQSNEPSHHYPYLYDFGGEPWKTQAKVREIAAKEYGYGPGGLDGDDDCGQMSAWLLFTAMGFYPVNPASGDYMIGSPLYREMSIRLANGKTFRIEAENNSPTDVYIQSATLNGKALTVPMITWEQIQSGATLRFVMGARPSAWGSEWRPAPVLSR